MARRGVVVLVVAAVLVAATGWWVWGRVDSSGPLSMGDANYSVCMAGGTGTRKAAGDRSILHVGSAPVTITGVSLVNAVDVVLLDAVLLRREGNTLIGSGAWPIGGPEDEFPLPEHWDERVPAVGAVVQPGEEWIPLVGLESRGSETAYLEGIRWEYEGSWGRRYEVVNVTERRIRPKCSSGDELE